MQSSDRSKPSIEGLMRRHYAYILRLALSILDDLDDAEDAAQETFVRAAAALDSFRGEASEKTWLYSIAVNVCASQLRRLRRRRALESVLKGILQVAGQEPGPEENSIDREQDRLLRNALQNLDEKHRIPIVLHYLEGMSALEIAEILKVKCGTVYSRLHYAREKLARFLGQTRIEAEQYTRTVMKDSS
jgi:RNA polymerase sigma-70 factor, ECF subfamily